MRAPNPPDELAMALYARIRELARSATVDQIERMAATGADLTNALIADAMAAAATPHASYTAR